MKYLKTFKSHGKGWTGGISMYKKNLFNGPRILQNFFQNQN